jgi:hypothetical protein
MLLKNKGRAAMLAVAALLAAAVAGGWHWQNNHNTKASHPKAGWAWGDERAVVVSDFPLASE